MMSKDLQWLRDCGWRGWCVDLFTGQIHTHHGDVYPSPAAAREFLESLAKWPRVRNVPRRQLPTPAGTAVGR